MFKSLMKDIDTQTEKAQRGRGCSSAIEYMLGMLKPIPSPAPEKKKQKNSRTLKQNKYK
jgi:hypothetical protein